MKKILFLFFMSMALHTQAEEIQCKVTKVVDGSSFRCKAENNALYTVSLYQISSPKIKEKYGVEARLKLRQAIYGDTVKVDIRNKLNARNVVGVVSTMGMCSCYPHGDVRNINTDCGCWFDIAPVLLREGFARVAPSTDNHPIYQQAEQEAKKAKRGIWADQN